MNYLKNILLFLFCSLAIPTIAQETGIIKGRLIDEIGIPVKTATIYIKGVKIKTYTDSNGYFKLEVPANKSFKLRFYHSSYKSKFISIHLKPNTTKTIRPIFKYRVLPIYTVYAKHKRGDNIIVLEKRDGKTVFITGDFTERLKTEIGVASNNELSSGYNVRGGNFEENLIYVNDIEIYRPFLARSGQQEGLSFINSDLVEDIHFSAGGFQAKYGDKLSSVLDVTYKKPRDFGGSGTISLLGANAHLEGVSNNELWTHVSGIRYRTNQYLFGALDTKGEFKPVFADFQTHITYTSSGNWEHSFLGNYALNKYRLVPENRETSFGSINQALRFTVFFDGQEITQFETFTGAFTSKYTPNDSTTLKFTGSAYRTFQTEKYDVEGQYWLDELERDPSKDNFGDVAFNIGVGGFLRHARNSLDATVTTLAHKGERRYRKNNVQWGIKAQYDKINDKIKEWSFTDSTGFISPRPSDSIGYRDSSAQNYQYLKLDDLTRAKNTVETGRFSAYVQNTWNLTSYKNTTVRKTKKVNDTIYKVDSTFKTYSGLILTAGIRSNYWTFNNEIIVSPRVSFQYRPKYYFLNDTGKLIRRKIVYRGAVGVYQQPAFYREYRYFDGSLNHNIQAQRSLHFLLGADYEFTMWDRPFKLTSEIYYKLMDRVIPYDIDNVRVRYYAENNAKAYSKGIDLKINGKFIQGLESWATLSVMQTKIDINNDVFYTYLNSDGDTIIPGFTNNNVAVDSLAYYPGYLPRPTDQRISFGLFFQDEMPTTWNTENMKWDKFKVNLNFIYTTGFSYLNKKILANPFYENQNFIPRTKNYLRADIGFTYDFISEKHKAKKKFWQNIKEISMSLEIFNLLGIDNVVSYNFIQATNGRKYAIPNTLTKRLINLKFNVKF